jgi:hypothetical protein
MQTLSEAFRAIENAADAGEPQAIKPLLANLPVQTEAAIRQLRHWLQNQNQKKPPVI